MSISSSVSRRSLLKGAAASALVVPAAGIYSPAIAQRRDRIILGTTQEPVQFNPLLYVNAGAESIPEALMFDALWDVDNTGNFIPNLAARIPTVENGDVSADARIWRINLKRDVKWSDGQPFTARDVAFTYQTIINPKVAVRSRSGFDLIKNFKVVDDYTVEIELERPYVPFMWAWQNMHIVPHHILSKEENLATSGYNAKPVGTGPYMLKTRTAGSHMVYEANPNYHRGRPKIGQFIHKFVPDQLVAYGQARTGEVDYLGVSGVPFDRWSEAAKISDRTFFSIAQPWVQFVYFNCERPQFKDPKVRKALALALEMQKGLDNVYFGAYKRTLSYLHPSHWAYNSDLKDDGPNPELASKMLDEAGWKRGADGIREKDGVKLKFSMSTTSGVPARQATQAIFQQNWKAIGVDMEIKNMPASVVWGEYTTKSQFDTLLVSWEPTVGMDPDYTARAHSKMIPAKTGQGSNYTQYQNAEVDKLLEEGVRQTDIAQRKKTYHRVQEILFEEMPFVPQGGVYQGHMTAKGLQGIKPNQYVVDATWNVHEWSWG